MVKVPSLSDRTLLHKSLVCLCISVLLTCSCTDLKQESGKTDDKRITITKLLSLYKPLPGDTLLVRSSANQTPSNLFTGNRIDTSLYQLYGEEIPVDFSAEHELFACYSFNIDASHIGLITRMPGEYVSSSIKLLLVDTSHSGFRIEHSSELADHWADAGESFSIDSWLYKNKAGNREWFCWRQFCSDTGDCTDSLALFHILNGKIQSIPSDSTTLQKLKTDFQK